MNGINNNFDINNCFLFASTAQELQWEKEYALKYPEEYAKEMLKDQQAKENMQNVLYTIVILVIMAVVFIHIIVNKAVEKLYGKQPWYRKVLYTILGVTAVAAGANAVKKALPD